MPGGEEGARGVGEVVWWRGEVGSGGEGRWGVVGWGGGVVERGGKGRETRRVPPLFHAVDETRKIPDTLLA